MPGARCTRSLVCGHASWYKHQIRRWSFGYRMRDTEQQCVTLCHHWACFLADKPHFNIRDA